MKQDCPHQRQVKNVKAQAGGCQECQATGESYVAARVCRVCGHVGCCDSSPKTHARQHFKDTGHAILSDLQDTWRWCYVCDDYVKK